MELKINQIYKEESKLEGKEIEINGWVKSLRQKKFLIINDGSCLQNLQIIIPENLVQKVEKINFGSALYISGKLILTPEKAQRCELQAKQIRIFGSVDGDYPFQKKKLPLEMIRNYPNLRAKTNYFLAIFRLRHSISRAIHNFFFQEEFYHVSTPIITFDDCEGAGETFQVRNEKKTDFFLNSSKLTVSGQLQAEALAQGLGKIYTFGPCFRAEKSHTTRHLAEFWMVEPELTFTNLKEIIKLAEKMIKYILNYVLENNFEELIFLEEYNQKKIIKLLKKTFCDEFKIIDYQESIKILEKNKSSFVFNKIKWGMDLQSEHEKYLCQYFSNQPVFVTNYPIHLKAFYMKNNSDEKTVSCFDLLLPQIGELIGGSMRENDYKILQEKALKIGSDTNNLNWYLNLRRYGYAPSGGFGLGLERLIMYIAGAENIRDTIAFPRFAEN